MKYMIEFDLPDNDTVLREIKTAYVAWGVWGYGGYTKAKPVQRRIPWGKNTCNSMVFTLRKVLNGGDMDAVDRNNIKRLLVLMEEGQERWKN